MLQKDKVGTMILRVVLGLTFFVHGLDKFQAGIGQTVGFFESIGLPGFLAYVVAAIELIGGLALIVGVGTRVVSILLALIMAGAMIKVKFAAGFLGGFELDLALLAISVFLALNNRSSFALDNVIFDSKTVTK